MNRVLLGLVSAIALSTSGFAADMYSHAGIKDETVDVPPVTWTGYYVGVQGGYGLGNLDGNVFYSPAGVPTYHIAGKQKTDFQGAFGGGQIGYNKQFGRAVVGVEADFAGSDLTGDATFRTHNYGIGVNDYDFKEFKANIDYFGTVRGRAGYAFGNVLPYVTGGFAYGHTKLNNTVTWEGTPYVSDINSAEATLTGWTLGGGLEANISGNWSVKAEYLYVDLGNHDFLLSGTHYAAPGSAPIATRLTITRLTLPSAQLRLV